MLPDLVEPVLQPVDDDDLLAPISIAARAAIWPTPPAPQTATTSPGPTPAWCAPVHPVGAASEANRARSSLTPSGTGNAPWSAYGTRM